ncbi:hypothetical protein [Mesorhizobium sp. M6A.T.Ce.TU.016.01.1.1]|uniref:hypothetical protein n=1 Tax=Mesorhizobium sp. M6A.T.Ce.TU.016.01.1.1 TaxID=2496783 RepID=UPI001FDF96F9|nr:hypothetical protein [Mesorhizobium sp. M6A.T.Ce.TU.016.01.1.1]
MASSTCWRWTVIGSAEDAARVSQALASVTLIDRTHYGGGDMEQDRDGDADPAAMHDRLTDMSEAIDFASLLLTSSPHATERAVTNICANGTDNFAGGTESSRDAALELLLQNCCMAWRAVFSSIFA